MPKIIDKDLKKREIAIASIPIFAQNGIEKTTVESIAKAAKVGKGTVYLYFQHKEEIILELWNMVKELQKEHTQIVTDRSVSSEETILRYFRFDLFLDRCYLYDLFLVYREYLGAVLLDKRNIFSKFHTKMLEEDIEFLKNVIEEGIRKGEFIETDSQDMATCIVTLLEGLMFRAKAYDMPTEAAQLELTQRITNTLRLIKKGAQ